ncbi:Signal recognition particle receptor subunit beta [Liparis tanakae]|uniref:Signal recognition particle receptor subunit beta n=1 Tax=Liparis tanakae TaxID=230148 RepID=A0A4Z2IS20_9TELE|nr:Signal recognition particle receptor subunit beta [Liparis tanakae]
MEADNTGGDMEGKADMEMPENPFEPYIESLRQQLEEQDPVFLVGVFVALAAVVITCVFLKYFLSSKTVRSAVLLVGLCDAGKTLLFSRLLSGKFKRTQTSITDSSAPYRAKNDKKEVRDVAEFLYILLTDAVISRNAPALLIACNKQDITMAKSAKLIQQQLEKEMNTLRVTLSAALSSQDGAVGGSVHLGKKGKDFEFSHLPLKVEFLECSARGSKGEEGDSDIESLEKSLAKL